MRLSQERMTYLICFIVAIILYWQARKLTSWGLLGPGPGLFPQLTTGFCSIVAATLAIFPALGKRPGGKEKEEEPPLGPKEKRLFWIYVCTMPFLVIAASYFGFIVMSVLVVMLLTWWAEKEDWRYALLFGVLSGITGVIGFGYFLNAEVPSGPLDVFVLRLLQ